MIFRVDKTESDTCGNEWSAGEPEYIESDTLKDAWIKLNNPRISCYWLDGEKDGIPRYRTPEGKGYGQWEENPEFDFERDIDNVSSFDCIGFSGIKVRKINIR